MKSILLILLSIMMTVFLTPTRVYSQEDTLKAASGEPSFAISTIQDFSGAGGWYIQDKGKRIELKGMRIAFKLKDDSLTSLETARIYLYDSKKELIQTLDNYSVAEKTMAGVPNLITNLHGLQKNKVYNILFPYPKNTKWKYAVAVIGTSQQVVADTIPSSAKVADFDFKEKALLLTQ